jgi:hypothetical protein
MWLIRRHFRCCIVVSQAQRKVNAQDLVATGRGVDLHQPQLCVGTAG